MFLHLCIVHAAHPDYQTVILQPNSEAYRTPLVMVVIITNTIATPQQPQPLSCPLRTTLWSLQRPVCITQPVDVAKGRLLDAVPAGWKVLLGATSDRTVGRGWVKEGGKGGKEGPTREIISCLDSCYSRHQLQCCILWDGRKESHSRGVMWWASDIPVVKHCQYTIHTRNHHQQHHLTKRHQAKKKGNKQWHQGWKQEYMEYKMHLFKSGSPRIQLN